MNISIPGKKVMEVRLYKCSECGEIECVLMATIDSKNQVMPYKCPFNKDMNAEVMVNMREL